MISQNNSQRHVDTVDVLKIVAVNESHAELVTHLRCRNTTIIAEDESDNFFLARYIFEQILRMILICIARRTLVL